ncbi:hypothetical protein EHO59_14980 [Leptospira semungkisensis]|uniref:Uncharacterized protein n=1 Tax=Leptospira semungkisensis TaxID=2484985 RepID=A0A4R9FL86_9LEPT|nr:hypothetical protein [Leptospira semungkisensis]TGJ99180.1 hypothetical protein EHO59_14980 [Leptospira semungkisensis]
MQSPLLRFLSKSKILASYVKFYPSVTQSEVQKDGLCFSQETFIKTKEGYILIEKLKVGDYVLGGIESSGELAYKVVTETFLEDVHSIKCKIQTQAIRKCAEL